MGGTAGPQGGNQWVMQSVVPFMGSTNPNVTLADAITKSRQGQSDIFGARQDMPDWGSLGFPGGGGQGGRAFEGVPLLTRRMR